MITIHDVAQGTPEWHELRKGRWTGSRAIKLLQGKALPDDSGIYQSDAMKRGTLLEGIAIKEYERKYGVSVQRPGFITNSKYPNAGYSPDGACGDILLEVKCLNAERHQKLLDGDIPIEYLAQIYFGLVICELKKARLLAFNPDFPEQLVVIDIDVSSMSSIHSNIVHRLEADLKKRKQKTL